MPLKEIIPSERFLDKSNIDQNKQRKKNDIEFKTEIIESNDEEEII